MNFKEPSIRIPSWGRRSPSTHTHTHTHTHTISGARAPMLHVGLAAALLELRGEKEAEGKKSEVWALSSRNLVETFVNLGGGRGPP